MVSFLRLPFMDFTVFSLRGGHFDVIIGRMYFWNLYYVAVEFDDINGMKMEMLDHMVRTVMTHTLGVAGSM